VNDDLLQFVYNAIDEALANIHTVVIARVTAVNEKTINCKPVIARKVGDAAIPLPEFLNVPPVFMRGGATYDAHPIAVGDFALLLISERCFDNWYGGSNDVAPNVHRMFDYSDGFALVGVSPFGSAITIPTESIRRAGDSEVTGDYTHEGDYVLTGNVTINGNLTVNGNGAGGGVTMQNTSITLTGGDITADGVTLKTHTHGGVQTGGGNTGVPN